MNLENLNEPGGDLNETYDDIEEDQSILNNNAEPISNVKDSKYRLKIIDTQISSSLHLQIMLYFNFFLNLVVFALEIASSCFKLYIFQFRVLYAIRILVVCVWIFVANFRLYNGYIGNINENMYNLLISILVTFLFDFGLQFLYIFPNKNEVVFHIDFACAYTLFAFQGGEIIFMILAMLKINKKQTDFFRLRFSKYEGSNVHSGIKTSTEIEQELMYMFPNLVKTQRKKKKE